MLLGRCTYDKQNYNLNIVDMPKIEDEEDDEPYTLDEQLEDQRSMHEDLMSLERSWDRQERYEREEQGVNKTLFDS